MDEDIRDFNLDDDFFDPFGDDEDAEGEDAPACAPDAQTGEDALVGAPLVHEKAAQPELSAAERIDKLLASMPGQRRLLLKVIGFAREERSVEEMDAFINAEKEYCNSVYSPVVLRELLEQAGALRYLAAQETGEEEFVPAAETGRAMTPALKAHVSDDEAGVLVPIVDEAKVVREDYVEGDDEVQIDFLEIDEPQPGMWVATEEGLAVVDAMDDTESTRQLIAKEPVYVDIYHQILDFVSAPYGRSAKEIDRLVNSSPLLEEPRRYSGYFVARLEREGAIEWRDGWVITPAGTEVLEGMSVNG